jgi:SPP1 family predicted phage head-tail adaptor
MALQIPEAGRFRHRISIQQKVMVLDSNGDADQDPNTGEVPYIWTEFAKRWAAIEPLSAKEFIQSQATQSQITARIIFQLLPDLNAGMRIVHNGTVYNIHGILPDKDSGLWYQTCPVSCGVNEEGT